MDLLNECLNAISLSPTPISNENPKHNSFTNHKNKKTDAFAKAYLNHTPERKSSQSQPICSKVKRLYASSKTGNENISTSKKNQAAMKEDLKIDVHAQPIKKRKPTHKGEEKSLSSPDTCPDSGVYSFLFDECEEGADSDTFDYTLVWMIGLVAGTGFLISSKTLQKAPEFIFNYFKK